MSRAHKSFLHRIFLPSAKPVISEGWIYSSQEAEVYGGYTAHQAIDFSVPKGTPVLAAADGFALASFEEVPIRYPGPMPRTWHGEPVFWGHGLHVLILHANKLVTVYGHLHALAAEVQPAYTLPIELDNGDVLSALSPLKARDFRRKFRYTKVHAEQVIGYAGITGMGMGVRTYDGWLHGKPFRANDEEHVHFAVSTLPALAAETAYIDPFGIDGSTESYPLYGSDWSSLLPNTLWLK